VLLFPANPIDRRAVFAVDLRRPGKERVEKKIRRETRGRRTKEDVTCRLSATLAVKLAWSEICRASRE